MEVKIGISDSPRELVIASEQTPAEVEAVVTEALAGGNSGVVALTDEKGRKFLVQAAKIAYVELGPAVGARVGFTARQ